MRAHAHTDIFSNHIYLKPIWLGTLSKSTLHAEDKETQQSGFVRDHRQLRNCKPHLITRLVMQQGTAQEHTAPPKNTTAKKGNSMHVWDYIMKNRVQGREKAQHSILGYLCWVVVTGRKLQSVLQIIITMKVIQWNRPAGTDSVCQDEAGNEHHPSGKENWSEERMGGVLQRWI